jgi:hypothetical protein
MICHWTVEIIIKCFEILWNVKEEEDNLLYLFSGTPMTILEEVKI